MSSICCGIQFERQRTGLFPSIHEYARLFGMDGTRLKRARPDILILAPGPINRGVEITPEVADGPAFRHPASGNQRIGGAHGRALFALPGRQKMTAFDRLAQKRPEI
jgi:aspartate carbamoyltransferase catalytic subunit